MRFSVLRWFSLLAMIILTRGLVDSPTRYGGNLVIIMIIRKNNVGNCPEKFSYTFISF